MSEENEQYPERALEEKYPTLESLRSFLPMRHIVQITSTVVQNPMYPPRVFALCSDGSVWFIDGQYTGERMQRDASTVYPYVEWKQLPDIPQQ